QVAAVVLAQGRALVLHEAGLDLAVAEHEPQHVVAREVLAAAAQLHPDDQAPGVLLERALHVQRLERLVLEGGMAGGHGQPVEGREDGDVAPIAADPPLPVEVLGRGAALSRLDRRPLVGVVEGQRGGARLAGDDDERRRGHPEQAADHFVAPTTTRQNVSGPKKRPATRCTSAAVTLATAALYRSA